jgi:hypothetical protein
MSAPPPTLIDWLRETVATTAAKTLPPDPPPVLTPEEWSDAPVDPQQRDKRAELLRQVRVANHPYSAA